MLSPLTQKGIVGMALVLFIGGGFISASTYWVQQRNYVALVNQQRIPREAYLRREIQMQSFLQGQTLPDNLLRQMTVNELIERQLLLQEAEQRQLSVSSAEVQTEWDTLLNQTYQGDHAKMQRDLQRSRYTPAEFSTELRERLLTQKVREALSANAKPSEADYKKYYDEHQQEFQQPEKIEARHILLHIDEKKPASEAETLKKAQALLKELQQGADFAALAKKHSQDSTTQATGGLLPPFAKGEMVPEFEKAVWNLAPGTLAASPVKSQYGYHLILRGKTIPAGLQPYTDAKKSFAPQLEAQHQQQVLQQWLQQARQQAEIQIHPDYQAASPPPLAQPSAAAETKPSASASSSPVGK